MAVLTSEQLQHIRAAPVRPRGNRLDLAIRLSRLPQYEIARSLQVQPTVISGLKHGRRRRVPVDLANRIATYFGCDVGDLFPSEQLSHELVTEPVSSEPVAHPRSGIAGSKRTRRVMRAPECVYPLAAHLEKQRVALFEMLTDARIIQRLTLQDVADRLDRTRQQIEQWETAARSLRIDTFMEWADALGFRLYLEPLESGDAVSRVAADCAMSNDLKSDRSVASIKDLGERTAEAPSAATDEADGGMATCECGCRAEDEREAGGLPMSLRAARLRWYPSEKHGGLIRLHWEDEQKTRLVVELWPAPGFDIPLERPGRMPKQHQESGYIVWWDSPDMLDEIPPLRNVRRIERPARFVVDADHLGNKEPRPTTGSED